MTGLMWQQDGSVSGLKSLTELDAYLNTLNLPPGLGGYTDWRLPTAQELSSLVDSGYTFDGGVNQSYGSNGDFTLAAHQNPFYWTSTPALTSQHLDPYPLVCAAGDRILVRFRHGTVLNSCDPELSVKVFYVLAVRREQPAADPSFVVGADTVLDKNTGLMWQKLHGTKAGVVHDSFKWGDGACDATSVDALCYCDSLALGGYDDWRLPNRNEMHSIFDYNNDPTLADAFLVDAEGHFYFWTSTSHNEDSSQAWAAGPIDAGKLSQANNKSNTNHVRCVRNTIFNLRVFPAGSGTGTVTSNPEGIDCSLDGGCAGNFENSIPATLITLTAKADDNGSTFTGWSGAGCTGTGTCTVTMDANKAAVATFYKPSMLIKFISAILSGATKQD